jgi:hypothetical protein
MSIRPRPVATIDFIQEKIDLEAKITLLKGKRDALLAYIARIAEIKVHETLLTGHARPACPS